MHREHKSIPWAWVPMLMAAFYLFTGTAMGEPLIITVRPAAPVAAVPPAKRIETTVANGVEIVEPRSPQAPGGLDEQLTFVPKSIEVEPLDGRMERRRPVPSAPAHIVVHRWQPGSESASVTHRYRGLRERPSLIITHRIGS